jgi:hypothetical protein
MTWLFVSGVEKGGGMPEGDEVRDGRVGIGLMVCRFTAEGTWRWCFSSTVETKTAKLDPAVDLCLNLECPTGMEGSPTSNSSIAWLRPGSSKI